MMSRVGCGSVIDEGILEDNYDLKLETAIEDEETESLTDISSNLEDSEMMNYCTCVRSFNIDSGFNSDNESRDSFDENTFDTNCDFECDNEELERVNIGCYSNSEDVNKQKAEIRESIKNCKCIELECDCLKSSSLDSLPRRNRNQAIRLKSVVKSKMHENPDLVLLNHALTNVSSDIINNRSNCSTKNQIVSRTHRPVSAGSSVDSSTAASLRTVRRSRRIIQDMNNNSAGSRNLNSYLKKAPFKLHDCFQNQGFLALIACIIYTLILMVIIGFISMAMAYLKSYIGTQNLKTIRKNIVHHRRVRESMAAG